MATNSLDPRTNEDLINLPRPRPIKEAFKTVGSAVTFIGSVVAALVGWGVLNAVQGDALTTLLGLIPGAVTAVTGALAAFGVTKRAEAETTPLEDPIDDDGTPLIRMH